MTDEFKTRWLAALRSGDYAQGTGALRHDGRHCCVGVALDLLDPSRWHGCDWGACDSGSLPRHHGDPLQLGGHKPWTVENQLASMNDDGVSFGGIADWIEANVATEAP